MIHRYFDLHAESGVKTKKCYKNETKQKKKSNEKIKNKF